MGFYWFVGLSAPWVVLACVFVPLLISRRHKQPIKHRGLPWILWVTLWDGAMLAVAVAREQLPPSRELCVIYLMLAQLFLPATMTPLFFRMWKTLSYSVTSTMKCCKPRGRVFLPLYLLFVLANLVWSVLTSIENTNLVQDHGMACELPPIMWTFQLIYGIPCGALLIMGLCVMYCYRHQGVSLFIEFTVISLAGIFFLLPLAIVNYQQDIYEFVVGFHEDLRPVFLLFVFLLLRLLASVVLPVCMSLNCYSTTCCVERGGRLRWCLCPCEKKPDATEQETLVNMTDESDARKTRMARSMSVDEAHFNKSGRDLLRQTDELTLGDRFCTFMRNDEGYSFMAGQLKNMTQHPERYRMLDLWQRINHHRRHRHTTAWIKRRDEAYAIQCDFLAESGEKHIRLPRDAVEIADTYISIYYNERMATIPSPSDEPLTPFYALERHLQKELLLLFKLHIQNTQFYGNFFKRVPISQTAQRDFLDINDEDGEISTLGLGENPETSSLPRGNSDTFEERRSQFELPESVVKMMAASRPTAAPEQPPTVKDIMTRLNQPERRSRNVSFSEELPASDSE